MLLCDLGVANYEVVHDLQLRLVDEVKEGLIRDGICLLVEHPSVFTLGKNSDQKHLGVNSSFLREKNISLVRVERGGEVTYHGPGQLILYPVFHLKRGGFSVRDYVTRLEEVMLKVLSDYFLVARRDIRNPGVWINEKKIGSLGICIRRSVTFHGFSINVNVDLEPFSWITPCGLPDVIMTSMKEVLNQYVCMEQFKSSVIKNFKESFGVSFEYVSRLELVGLLK